MMDKGGFKLGRMPIQYDLLSAMNGHKSKRAKWTYRDALRTLNTDTTFFIFQKYITEREKRNYES